MMQTWYLVFVMMMSNGNIDTMVQANIEQWKNVIMKWMNICIQPDIEDMVYNWDFVCLEKDK